MAFALEGPTAITVKQGESASAVFRVLATSRPYRGVSLSVSGLPSGLAMSFQPSSGKPTFQSTLTVTASLLLAIGDYTITIRARDAKSSKSMSMFVHVAQAEPRQPPSGYDPVKAFPTAEGCVASTVTGGRSGTVIQVSNTNDSGGGSLRAAMTTTGTRTIIFTVSGTITLLSDIILNSTHSNFTIAGQTSPGGIQLRGNGLNNDGRTIKFEQGCNNGIIRHLRYRPGSTSDAQSGFIIWSHTGNTSHNHSFIWDHCSLSWFNDAAINLYKFARDCIVQWCLISEGCDDPGDTGHPIGITECLADGKFSVHHNIFSNFDSNDRNPWCARGDIDFVNNFAYNVRSVTLGSYGLNNSVHFNDVKNKYISGPNSVGESWYDYVPTISNEAVLATGNRLWSGGVANGNGGAADRSGTKVFINGSWYYRNPSGSPSDYWGGFNSRDRFDSGGTGALTFPVEANVRVGSRYNLGGVAITEHAVANLEAALVAAKGVGAWATSNSFGSSNRDQADLDIIADVSGRTGQFSDIGNGGPWPTLSGTGPTDTNGDGIPDVYDNAHGLNPNDGGHFNTVAPNGYTWGENYINELAGDTVTY